MGDCGRLEQVRHRRAHKINSAEMSGEVSSSPEPDSDLANDKLTLVPERPRCARRTQLSTNSTKVIKDASRIASPCIDPCIAGLTTGGVMT